MAGKKDFEHIGYIFGIISIVLAFFQPLAGFIFGIIGFNHAKKMKTPLAKKAKKYNIIGIVLSLILFLISAVVAYFATQGLINNLTNFPIV